jgi:hypothetical protein
LKIAVVAGDKVLGIAAWHFGDVICGHADPMHFSVDIEIDDGMFGLIDRIELQKTDGWSQPCE